MTAGKTPAHHQDLPVKGPCPVPAVAQSPTIDTVPAAGLTSTSSDSKSSPAAEHGLTKGAIAGIVLGSLVGAALLMTLAAFTITKVSHHVLLLACAIVFI